MRKTILYFIFCICLVQIKAQNTSGETGLNIMKNRTFFNLENYWDSEKVCENPDKGWELHYFDNSIDKYGFFLVNGDNDRPDAFKDFSAKLNTEKIDNKVVVLPDTKHNLGLYYERSVMDLLAFLGKHLEN